MRAEDYPRQLAQAAELWAADKPYQAEEILSRILLGITAADPTSYIKAYMLMAEVGYELGKYRYGRACGERALAVLGRVHAETSLLQATALITLGDNCRGAGEYRLALCYHQKALAARQELLRLKLLEANHLDVAWSHNNLGMIY